MIGGPAARDALERARRSPSLRVGLHLVLVDGRPLLDPASLPDLVQADGRFRTNMGRAGVDIFFKPRVRRQLAAEITAQFEAYAATGLPLDHVNTHKHFHLHPTVAAMILQIGGRFGMTAMRAPTEPRAVLFKVEPGVRSAPAYLTAPWSALLKRRLRRAGLQTPDHVFGLHWSGAMTQQRLLGLIRHLPAGLSEIYLHPATANGYEGSAPGYRYVDEFEALIAPQMTQALKEEGVVLGGFADFRRAGWKGAPA
jgi:hopanoid biosynthesis associated protein HpnK